MTLIVREQRCKECGKLLLRGMVFSGLLEIKCVRCKTENTIYGIGGAIHQEGTYAILFDHEGRVIDVDNGASDILGYSREVFMAMKWDDLGSDVGPAEYHTLRDVVMRLDSVAFDTAHRKKNGAIIPVRLQVRVLISDSKPYALIIGHPLKEPHGNHEDTPAFHFSLNEKREFVYLCRRFAELLGQKWVSVLGKEADMLLDLTETKVQQLREVDPDQHFFHIENVHAHGSPVALKLAFHTKRDVYDNFVGYDVVGFQQSP